MDRLIPQRSPRKGEVENFKKLLNQEDFLAEISERLLLEMRAKGMSEGALAEFLGKDESYIDGLVNGFANITVRELADVFSVFNKIISLGLLELDRKEDKAKEVVSLTIPCAGPVEFDRIALVFEKNKYKYEAEINFVSTGSLGFYNDWSSLDSSLGHSYDLTLWPELSGEYGDIVIEAEGVRA